MFESNKDTNSQNVLQLPPSSKLLCTESTPSFTVDHVYCRPGNTALYTEKFFLENKCLRWALFWERGEAFGERVHRVGSILCKSDL